MSAPPPPWRSALTFRSRTLSRPSSRRSAPRRPVPYTVAQTVTVSATATDNVAVTRVDFYDGSTLKGSDTSAPYSVAWSVTSADNGSHTWTAKAYDAANNVGTSGASTVTVNIAETDKTAPTAPTGISATAASTTRVNLSWTASTDNVGVTAYLVERCQGAGCSGFAQVGTATATSYADTGVAASLTYRYRVRARDAADNRSAYSAIATVATPGASGCTGSSVWASTAKPSIVSDSDTASVELGMKFRSDVDGYVCGVRFYKGSLNTGTHVGSLWSSSGTRLAKATFTQETASGWQQVSFASPVAIKAGTVYVVSYLAPKGRYSADVGYFTSAGVDAAPLHALKTGVSGGNSVYLYGKGGFPTKTWSATNYWVDVVFVSTTATASLSSLLEEAAPLGDSIGVYRPKAQLFYLDTDGSYDWSADDTTSEPFGKAGDIAIVGDWTGDGIDKIGLYRPSTHAFYLDLDGDNSFTAADLVVTSYGVRGDLPVIGDWNADGIDEIGVFRPKNRRFYLDVDNSHSTTVSDVQTAAFGLSTDLPVAGDWNGDGADDIGVYRPSTARFLLDMDNSYSWTTGDIADAELRNRWRPASGRGLERRWRFRNRSFPPEHWRVLS